MLQSNGWGSLAKEDDEVVISTPKRGLERLVRRLFPLPRKPAAVRKEEKRQRLKDLQARVEVEAAQAGGRRVSAGYDSGPTPRCDSHDLLL